MKRRKIRRYGRGGKNSGMKFTVFFAIIIIAVICGYLTARYIIAPFLGYNTDVLKPDLTAKFEEMIKEKDKTSNEENDKHYTLQYGVFSSRESAESLVSKLRNEGKKTSIEEVDGNFKVFGEIFNSKEEATKALKELNTKVASDVFVTVIP